MTQPNMTNALRAARAERILSRFRMGDDLPTSLVDLLADAMHWCDYAGEDFHFAFAQACRHYIHECNDQQQDERRLIP
ncbi:hypothetical protein [Planctomyces sp. SH-PL14]|uniref:hypothetical protein n=1 Tax=Planctomyces sp. SH-PL14 TaxID=1632864 RepID=UPI00078E409C|nr:hypothetical protein [Planctomyces sp. SH-PL14]AMV22602.1 hypothetical protein VT03_32200 [Planctomyces sp. SH-PL14]